MRASTIVTYLDKELISSESFHTLGIGTTTLDVLYGNERITIEFVVAEAAELPVNKMWLEVVRYDRIQVHIQNFRQLMPAQLLGPVELGSMAQRPLILVLAVTAAKPSPCKHISYSLYMGGSNA